MYLGDESMRMRRELLLILVINAGFSLFGGEPQPVHAGPIPSFMGLQPALGRDSSSAWGVSATGAQIGGDMGGTTVPYVWASRWSSDGSSEVLTDSSGRHLGWGGISSDGSTVAGVRIRTDNDQAFRWKEGIGITYLGDLQGGDFHSRAWGVSGDGNVVVGHSDSALSPGPAFYEAFRWTPQGGMMALGDLPGGFFHSSARAVSDDGNRVVGVSSSSQGTEAFLWRSNQGMIGLGDLAGGSFFSYAYGISPDGNYVVGNSTSASGSEAFRWSESEGMVGLGDLPGGAFSSIARDASFGGAVVVGSSLTNAGSAAFIWNAPEGMRELKSVLEVDFGLDLNGWTLIEATGVSADGTVIVGNGTHSGTSLGWVAVIPEPGVLSMLIVALPLVVSKFRRVRPECTLGIRA